MFYDTEAPGSASDVEVEFYPGTEIMGEDLRGNYLIHGHSNKDGVVLVPQPSTNSDDPLNWSLPWKWTVVVLQAVYILTSVISALSVAPLTPVFEAQFSKDAQSIALLTSVLVIVTGYTNLILVPVAEAFGRRFVLILSILTSLGASIWHGAAQSYGSFMGARILIAMGMSVAESLMPMVVSDIFFLHERGRYVGIYFLTLFNSMCLGPLIAGACAERFTTWRTFYWIISSLSGAAALAIIFLHPETKYTREETATTTTNTSLPPSPPNEKNISAEQVEKSSQVASSSGAGADEDAIPADQHLGRGRPSKWQFRLIQSTDRDAISKISRHVVTPFRLLGFPIVLWGAWMLAGPAAGLLAINYTQSEVLMAPPYNFNSGQVGLSNLALVCGGSLGVLTAGPLSDWVAIFFTKRNRGIREPEMRLASMIPFILVAVVACVVVGLGYDRTWPWEVVIVVGFGAIGLMMVSISTIGITYAVDCYKPVAGQIMIIATVLKNTYGFGMGYYVTGWVAEAGYTPLFMTTLALIVGPSLLGVILFSIFGKRLRKLTRNAKVHTY